eukprot:Clim_evm20s238 gene=Clim_evmTU20s238
MAEPSPRSPRTTPRSPRKGRKRGFKSNVERDIGSVLESMRRALEGTDKGVKTSAQQLQNSANHMVTLQNNAMQVTPLLENITDYDYFPSIKLEHATDS